MKRRSFFGLFALAPVAGVMAGRAFAGVMPAEVPATPTSEAPAGGGPSVFTVPGEGGLTYRIEAWGGGGPGKDFAVGGGGGGGGAGPDDDFGNAGGGGRIDQPSGNAGGGAGPDDDFGGRGGAGPAA